MPNSHVRDLFGTCSLCKRLVVTSSKICKAAAAEASVPGDTEYRAKVIRLEDYRARKRRLSALQIA